MTRSPAPKRVLVLTPLGQGGQGGIDRLMDEVRHGLQNRPRLDLDVRFVTTRGQGHIAGSALLMLKVGIRMAGRLFGRGPDVQHVNLSSKGSALRKIALSGFARLLGIPYVIHLHGSGFREYWTHAPPFLSRLIGTMFARADRILVLGRVWRDLIVQHVPESAGRIIILPNAVPAPRPRQPRSDGPVVILFLGHVGPRKGVPQLIEALATLPRSNDWSATIAGNGDIDAARVGLAQHGLESRVSITGWIGPEEVQHRLATADILVLPSLEENLPMSVIEGMAHGLAVVTTPVGAVEDIIEDGVTGLLVPPGDAPALAVALSRLVGDPALRTRLGAAAMDFHRQHLEIDRYIDRLADVWENVASKIERGRSESSL